MRALVLGHALDPTANAVAADLSARGGWKVERRDLAGLVAARWQQRLAADGTVTTAIESDSSDIGACDIVFNRLGPVQALAFRGWSPVDRDYGQAEWLALLVSWLNALGRRVIGAPDGSDLQGPAPRPWLWLAAAARVGLGVHPVGATTSARQFPGTADHVPRPDLLPVPAPYSGDPARGHGAPVAAQCALLVIGDAIFGEGDPGARVRHGCLALAKAQTTPVLAVRLAQTSGDPEWRFLAADPWPVIAEGAPLAALVALMVARAA